MTTTERSENILAKIFRTFLLDNLVGNALADAIWKWRRFAMPIPFSGI